MRFPFLELPGEPSIARPAIPVTVEGLESAPQRCLVDTGALRNLFGSWLAEAAAVSLEGAPEEQFAVGGVTTTGRMVRLDLALDRWRFDAAVWFCDPWPFAFNLLGQEGFLRLFRVTLSAAQGWLDCEPETEVGAAGKSSAR